jgi:regulator of sigma E protease
MTVLATIIVLGVLIFVHELGHFLAAKAVNIEVERFSIGLGPVIWGVKKGETEYVLSAIPLGGYVKMGGMADEMMDKVEGGAAQTERRPGPRDFDAKPVWARAFVISAGVIMNMLFALAVYVGAAAVWGIRSADTTRVGTVLEEVLPAGAEPLAEIQPGQRIERIGDMPVQHWGDVERGLVDADPGPLSIGLADPVGTLEVRVPADEQDLVRMAVSLVFWRDPVVALVTPGEPAYEGGVEAGDRILAVDGEPVTGWMSFVRMIESRPGERVSLSLERDGREVTRSVEVSTVEETDPATGEDRMVGKVGVQVQEVGVIYSPVAFGEAVRIGWNRTVVMTGVILDFLRNLFTGSVSPRSLGSIVTIGQLSGQAAAMGVESFLSFMALFSINLAVLNLLPIPILDGGHLVFLTIEAIRGKALSMEQRMRWSQVGLVVILGIMVLALSNDVLRLFGM